MKPFLNPKTKKELIKVIPVIAILVTAMLLIIIVGVFSANKPTSSNIATEFSRFYKQMQPNSHDFISKWVGAEHWVNRLGSALQPETVNVSNSILNMHSLNNAAVMRQTLSS